MTLCMYRDIHTTTLYYWLYSFCINVETLRKIVKVKR